MWIKEAPKLVYVSQRFRTHVAPMALVGSLVRVQLDLMRRWGRCVGRTVPHVLSWRYSAP